VAQYELMRAHHTVINMNDGVADRGNTMSNLAAGVLISEITTSHLLS